ncbi:hypothetical protein WR25_26544 isoform A [Diploscapter pachys]|uniref:Sodium/hydrogen exchanger n=1 Tax=Diploscapter pachys TaxID=2018661 RepID=A0A2A2LIE8_9BILA|nr:hypothetical protein WR25_26544 isoform A [Diploscapter pachys]
MAEEVLDGGLPLLVNFTEGVPEGHSSSGHSEHLGQLLYFLSLTLGIVLLKRVFKWRYIESVPESCCLLIVGVAGAFLYSLVQPNEEIYLYPSMFFYILLPTIVQDAGYNMRNKDFFRNLGTICLYAIVNTFFNSFAIGYTLYATSSYHGETIRFLDLLLFATSISAVDPVAVLVVFEEIHVNELLYILVFGESLLNDAVTIVLYNTIGEFLDPKMLQTATTAGMITNGVISFSKVTFGGIAIGIVLGLLSTYMMKLWYFYPLEQPVIAIVCPILIYLITDYLHFSGIMALMLAAMFIKHYMSGNANPTSYSVAFYIIKQFSSISENILFVYLGFSFFSNEHDFNFMFILITIAACVVYRFIGIFVLTFFANLLRHKSERIMYRDQFIMAYGGLRGAVCYGLVRIIDTQLVPAKHLFITTTVALLFFTIGIQGASIKWIVKFLNVKRSKKFGIEEKKPTGFELTANEVTRCVMDYVTLLSKTHDTNWVYRQFKTVDDRFLQRFLMVNRQTRGERIVTSHTERELQEFISKGPSSFSGLPGSYVDLQLQRSRSGDVREPKTRPITSQVSIAIPTLEPGRDPTLSLPRNFSASKFIGDLYEKKRISERRGKRLSVYSRHFMDTEGVSPTGYSEPFEADEENDPSYNLTFPSARASASLANSARKIKSVRTRRLSHSPSRGGKIISRHESIDVPATSSHYQTSRPPAIRFAIDEEDSPEESKKSTCELFSLTDLMDCFCKLVILFRNIFFLEQKEGLQKSNCKPI